MKTYLLSILMLALCVNATTFAVVNGEDITIDDINSIIKTHEEIPPFSVLNPTQKELIINQAIEQKLIIQEAKNEDITQSKEFIQSLAVIKDQLIKEFWFKQQFSRIQVTQEEIQTYYDKNSSNYKQDFMLKARHIIVENLIDAKRIIQQLQHTKGDVQKEFIELCKKNSIGPSASKGGDLGWFKEGEMLDSFWNKAKYLKEKTFTLTPLQTKYGYHIIYLDAKKESKTLTLEELYLTLKEELQRKKFQNAVAQKVQSLKEKAKIEIKFVNP